LVLGSGAALSLAGAIIGLLGGAAISRLLLATFPGIHANTSLILAGTTVLLVAVALIACWLPARRASHINPIDALRAD
jgi:ABC-type antimicrobial peptide transport system permease subunit